MVGTYLGQPGPNGASELLDIGGIAPVTPEVPHVFQAFSAILDEGETALTSAGSFLRRHFEHTHKRKGASSHSQFERNQIEKGRD